MTPMPSGAEPVPLVVLLGAGASFGAGEDWGPMRPPLTVDLFDEEQYGSLLEEYDLAHQAGRLIRDRRAADDALSLEQVLHELRISKHEHQRRMAYAVPPYLQHLLHTVSDRHFRQAFRYDRLIDRLLQLPEVCFLTLNYDVMLDRRLDVHHRLYGFTDYISEDKNWSLIKLHGSVNWWYDLPADTDPNPPSQEPRANDHDLTCSPPGSSLVQIRGNGAHDRFPALALPEGPEDRLVLPSAHLSWIRQRLAMAPNFDLLVIGYSGLDVEVLNLIQSAGREVRLLTVVDRSSREADRVQQRLKAAGISSVWTEFAQKDFAHWADSGGLDRLVQQFGGPYSDAF
jgi:hypothetical protein